MPEAGMAGGLPRQIRDRLPAIKCLAAAGV